MHIPTTFMDLQSIIEYKKLNFLEIIPIPHILLRFYHHLVHF